MRPIIPLWGTGVLLHFAAVSSRQEEKRRRREEREAREKAEKAAAARRKRLQLALGGLLGVAAIAAVVVVVVIGLGGDGGGEAGAEQASADVQIPEQRIGDLDEAAEAAGCRVTHPEIEGATHETREFRASDYKTNPPTSGNHFPEWSEDGVYDAGSTPELGMLVHTLEHGRINVQYKPGTPPERVRQLETLLNEQSEGYHMLLYENPTGMDAQVAATTWGHSVTCPEMNDQVFDVIRTFRRDYIDQGPEDVP
jgi:Protein of unknown function (DUF3105)